MPASRTERSAETDDDETGYQSLGTSPEEHDDADRSAGGKATAGSAHSTMKRNGRLPGLRLPIWEFFQKGTIKSRSSNNWEAFCLGCQNSGTMAKPMRGEKNTMEAHFYKCPYVEQSEKDRYQSGSWSANGRAIPKRPRAPTPKRLPVKSDRHSVADSDQEEDVRSIKSNTSTRTPKRKKITHEHYSAHSPAASIARDQPAGHTPQSTFEEERFIQYMYGVLGTVDPADRKRYIQAIKCTVAKLDLEIAGQDDM